jgi:hypothetical protein
MAVYKKVMREYLARLLTNTVDDEVLTIEHRSACHAFALQNTEQAKNMVIPTPQYIELPLYAKYRGGRGAITPRGPTHTRDGAPASPIGLLGTKEHQVVQCVSPGEHTLQAAL